MFIPDPYPYFLPIPDPGVKEAPDPCSGSATLEKTMQRIIVGVLVGGGFGKVDKLGHYVERILNRQGVR